MRKKNVYIDGLLAFVFTFLFFIPTLGGAFQKFWDDAHLLLQNSAYQGFSPKHFQWMCSSTLLGHWQPLTWLSYALDFSLFGLNPAGFHLTNITLHACNAFIACRLFHLLNEHFFQLSEKNSLSVLFATLFFSLHPLRVEPVAWIATRGYLLCSLFILLALLSYVSSVKKKRYPLLALFFFSLATLSKGIGVMFPFVLLVLDAYPLRRISTFHTFLRSSAEKIPFFTLSLIGGLAAFWAKRVDGGMLSIPNLGIAERVGQAGFNFWFYLWKTICPLHLSPLYNELPRMRIAALLLLAAALLLFLSLKLRKKAPQMLTALVIYGVFIFPMLGLTQSGIQVAADRFTYLSTLPFALIFGGLASSKQRIFLFLALCVLMALGSKTLHQSLIWENDRTLWRHATELSPANAQANNNCMTAFIDAHDLEEGLFIAQRFVYFKESQNSPVDSGFAYNNLGRIYKAQGLYDKAIPCFSRAIQKDPAGKGSLYARYNRALIYYDLGKKSEALYEVRTALKHPESRSESKKLLAAMKILQSQK